MENSNEKRSIESLTKKLIHNHLLVIFMIVNKMNHNIDPSKVLSYLNEMGYYNITAIQLKSFLKDLKNLIKFVNTKKEENQNIRQGLLYSLESTLISSYQKHQPTEASNDLVGLSDGKENADNIFNKLYSTGTICSRAKTKKAKPLSRRNPSRNDQLLQKEVEYIKQSTKDLQKQIKTINNLDVGRFSDLEINKHDDKKVITHLQPKYNFQSNSKASADQSNRGSLRSNSLGDTMQVCCRNKIDPAKKAYIVKETELRPRKNILITNVVCEDSTDRLIRKTDDWLNNKGELSTQIKTQSEIRPKEASEYTLPNKQNSQSKLEAFIRPRDQSSKKSKNENLDPVQLYHKYKSEWDSQKIPGENKYSNLRWEIRHRMLGASKIR